MNDSTFVSLTNAMSNQRDDVFFQSLQTIFAFGLTPDVTVKLLLLLGIECDVDDYHWALLHTVERSEPSVLYASIAQTLPELYRQNPQWCDRVVGRLFASRKEQSKGFDVDDFIAVFSASASIEAQSLLRSIAQDFVSTGHLSPELFRRIEGDLAS